MKLTNVGSADFALRSDLYSKDDTVPKFAFMLYAFNSSGMRRGSETKVI